MKMRLDRWLVTIGTGSRSEVKAWIRGGEAAVNGRTIRDSALSFDPEKDQLSLRGIPLDGRVIRHVMMNKPAGVLTAARDPKQPTVMDLLPEVYRRIGCMPVGRLDKDTTGLLILTNDGTLAHSLLDPKRHVWKRYIATVEGKLDESDVQAFAEGVPLKDFTAKPAQLRILEAGDEQSRAEVEVREGKFHQVKRMFGARGHEVTALHRAAFGPLAIPEGMKVGEHVRLTEEQIELLRKAVQAASEM